MRFASLPVINRPFWRCESDSLHLVVKALFWKGLVCGQPLLSLCSFHDAGIRWEQRHFTSLHFTHIITEDLIWQLALTVNKDFGVSSCPTGTSYSADDHCPSSQVMWMGSPLICMYASRPRSKISALMNLFRFYLRRIRDCHSQVTFPSCLLGWFWLVPLQWYSLHERTLSGDRRNPS